VDVSNFEIYNLWSDLGLLWDVAYVEYEISQSTMMTLLDENTICTENVQYIQYLPDSSIMNHRR